ncbi:MAG: hypothetical protein ACI9J3_000441 [Parvicellaceae bacterium]|jgi:hypothetical protein
MNSIYNVYLGDIKIGTTRLEKADPSMGVVFGDVDITADGFGYNFLKQYLKAKGLEAADDNPDEQLISSYTIPDLEVIGKNGTIIEGVGNQLDVYEGVEVIVTIEGITYPFYEEEFPHHCE